MVCQPPAYDETHCIQDEGSLTGSDNYEYEDQIIIQCGCPIGFYLSVPMGRSGTQQAFCNVSSHIDDTAEWTPDIKFCTGYNESNLRLYTF